MKSKNKFWETLCWLREHIEDGVQLQFWTGDMVDKLQISKLTAYRIIQKLLKNGIIEQVATMDRSKAYRVVLNNETLSFLYVAYLFQKNDGEISEKNLHLSVKTLFWLFRELPIHKVG